MTVLRHQHVTDDFETELLAQIAERLDELEFEKRGPPIRFLSWPMSVPERQPMVRSVCKGEHLVRLNG
jgi:hypothetical protein